jgi:hypothetical protein
MHRYLQSDRRDADLMWMLTDLRLSNACANVRIMQGWWGQDGFVFSGGLIEWRGKPKAVWHAETGIKPRQVPTLLLEDMEIWDALSVRFDGWHTYFYFSRQSDRSDADLMLTLTRAKQSLKNLKKTAQDMYDSLTPREREVMQRLFGTRRPE